MDTRTTSADFYPGGKTPVTAGGGITSGEGEAYNGEQRVPITSIEGLPERFTEGDMKSKIDDICKVLRTGGLALAAIMSFQAWGADGITVHGTRKDRIYNDGFVVTNVTVDLSLPTTNDVCNIVTNEVVIGKWSFSFNDAAISQAAKGWDLDLKYSGGRWYLTGVGDLPEYYSFEGKYEPGTSELDETVFIDWCFRNQWDGYWVSMTAEREVTGRRNALGLATAKDLEKLPTHETVTNVARSVVNSVWDASLGVAWEARMHNGHLYYIAVTNKPPEVK